MASMEMMREFVSQQYGGLWREKVKRMPDRQVACIYYRMIDELENARKKPVKPRIRLTEVGGGRQLSLFDNEWSTRLKEEYVNGKSYEAVGEGNN